MAPNQTSVQPQVDLLLNLYQSSHTDCVSINLKRASERLKTFQLWSVVCDFLKPEDLVNDGFYYTRVQDIVKCAFCGVEIGCWERGDQPHMDHVRFSKNCDFINGRECGNIPLSQPAVVTEPDAGHDVCGPHGNESRTSSKPEQSRREIGESDLWKDLEHLGVSKNSGPQHPPYSTYQSRIKSFENWPFPEVQDPKALAEAGFFYTNILDNSICFHCGGGLQQWDPTDDPWVEHARWFNKCGFINIQKGKEFVNEAMAKGKAVLPAKIVNEAPAASEKSVSECESKRTSEEPLSSSALPDPVGKQLELCVVCYSKDRTIVFLPCSHFVSCVNCAPSLSHCPICRKPYEATVRAYLS